MLLTALASLAGACAADGYVGLEYPMTVWNRSQFELLEIRVHPGPAFETADNLVEAGLPVEEHVLVQDFMSGSHLTVIRLRVEMGEQIAVTTARPVEIDRPGYTLVVFDTSFRLLEPDCQDNPFSDQSGR